MAHAVHHCSISPAEVNVPAVVTAAADDLRQQEGDAGVHQLRHLYNTILYFRDARFAP